MQEMEKNPLGKDFMILALVKLARLGEEDFADIQQPRQVGPVIHEVPDKDEGIQVEIREAGKRVVCRLNGKAREISARLAIVGIQRQLHEWWNDTANTKEQHEGAFTKWRESDRAVHIFRENINNGRCCRLSRKGMGG